MSLPEEEHRKCSKHGSRNSTYPIKMGSEYDRKFEEMKKYIPFLESMIKRLESSNSSSANPRQAQLDKIRSLRDLLLDKKKRMKMDNLLKCEQVLFNLYAKVEQRDSFSDIKPASSAEATNSTKLKDKSDLEIVRNKLKTVTKLQEEAETLPEIARASDIEQNCTPGSKLPALFQRRPNRSSDSPTRLSPIKGHPETKIKSPSSQVKRNYTRVLVSPEHSPSRWQSPEQSSSEKPLFSRRSPRRTSPSQKKKEKNKSRKSKDLNITLNVPEESLNSLNTKDILSRIINCSDGDVDIDTLRELRSQILGELKHTGKKDDISDLILKSYNKSKIKKIKSKIKKRKDEVEEGELSDSESEAIQSIYGSLVVMEKDKNPPSQVKTTTEKSNQQRKIQICLVINSDKDTTNKEADPQEIIDLSELEMYDEEEGNKNKDVISIDSDVSLTSSPNKDHRSSLMSPPTRASKDISQVKKNINFSSPVNKNKDPVEPPISDNVNNNQVSGQSEGNEKKVVSLSNDKNTTTSNENKDISDTVDSTASPSTTISPLTTSTASTLTSSSNEDVVKSLIKNDSSSKQRAESLVLDSSGTNTNHKDQSINPAKNSEQPTKFVANFYKPLQQHDDSEPTKSKEEGPKTTEIEKHSNIEEESSKDVSKNETSLLKGDTSTSTRIPLLNEPSLPPKAPKETVLSEIDILQALKNEILNESISIKAPEPGTPALHQPKLTKVASAQEIMPKKRISIEKYKQKAAVPNPLFIKRRSKSSRENSHKKQSLKLTEKECERFNFSTRLSLDDDDDDNDEDDDILDDDLLNDNDRNSLCLDDIYGDLAPQSPENETSNVRSTPPIIIPSDPVKTVVSSKSDIDMRSLPMLSPQPLLQPVPQPVPPTAGFNPMMSSSPSFNFDRPIGEANIDQNKKVSERTRLGFMDPRMRRDLNSTVNSPNPHGATNPDRTPRSAPFPSIMTPSYMPSVTPIMTPNARSFEMTPSHQSFEGDESSSQKHVYAPSFSLYDNHDRETSVSREPDWEMNKTDTSASRRNRWKENTSTSGPKWEDRNRRSNSGQTDSYNPLFDKSYKYDKFGNRMRIDKYHVDRRDNYSNADCPTTPIPSFGWSECPSTPGNGFGRQEAPMTPSHSFGRSDCPSTPSHPFGRSDCPTTPIHPFGRSDCPPTPSHSFGRSECSVTPSHPFGRSDCPTTPNHPFGRSDGTVTPSHTFGRSDSVPYNHTNQKYNKDPRLNRRTAENESTSYDEKDRGFHKDRNQGRGDSSFHSRNYARERREPSLGRSLPKDIENDRLYTRNRDNHYESRHSRNYDDAGNRRIQRDGSVGRKIPEDKHSSQIQSGRVPLLSRREPNIETLSVKSHAGRSFTINTSVKSSFQEFLDKPIKVFDYTFDARRKRASSVGRSLVQENSVGRALASLPNKIKPLQNNRKNDDRFKRASSVGRELASNRNERSFQEIKADFESFRTEFHSKNVYPKESNKIKVKHYVSPGGRKEKNVTQQNNNSSTPKSGYSPRNNYRDPRMRKEQKIEQKNRNDKRGIDSRHRLGIVYSSDNIAKGTIMGSGFGVKNYKIPKIKRPIVEKESEVDVEDKSQSKEKSKMADSKKVKENLTEKKVTEIITNKKEITKSNEPTLTKNKGKKEEDIKATNDVPNNLEKRHTRSNKKMSTSESKEDKNVVVKSRKGKKAVINDSESNSETEKETNANDTTKNKTINKSSNQKQKSEESVRSVMEKEVEKKSDEGILDSSFGIDLEIFSENAVSDPVIDNINALIADLDHHLDTTKTGNESFVTDIEKMMDSLENPEENSLGDISEVIEKDMNEKSENSIQDITSNNFFEHQKKHSLDANNTSLQNVSHVPNQNAEKIKLISELNETGRDSIAQNHDDTELPEGVKNKDNTPVGDTVRSKDNEAIVSTSDVDQNKSNEDDIKKGTKQNETVDDDRSTPDSTINKIDNVDKIEEGFPDSTNEIHNELNSDVTSTYEVAETSLKEADKSTRNEVTNVISILQDKSKLKEILSMLGDNSSENEKLKKTLEKLSEIVSDEEDEDEDHKIEDKAEKEETVPSTENKDDQKYNAETKKVIDEMAICNILDSKVTQEINRENKLANLEATQETVEKIDEMVSTPLENEVKDGTEEQDETSNLEEEDELDEDLDDEPLTKLKKNVVKSRRCKGKGGFKRTGTKRNKPVTRAAAIEKPKKPNRELQKLQEDIKEMFMSQDILNATGIRMCRLAKMVTENIDHKKEESSLHNSGPVVVLQKVKGIEKQEEYKEKVRKKPGPKPKIKTVITKSLNDDKSATKRESFESDVKMNEPKPLPKYKPGPKSRTKQKRDETDPYEFDTDSFADTNTTKDSDDDGSNSESDSLASSQSFGSSEVLDRKKTKPKQRKRRGKAWQSGIIKPKNRKKKDQKQAVSSVDDSGAALISRRPITIPDWNCFTDKAYCFRKGLSAYDCRLCVHNSDTIVNHYRKQHPHSEIPMSRMDPQTAALAIQQCEEINFQAISKIPSEKYICRFCHKEFSRNKTALEQFFWHVVSTHTGEYKQLCSECINVTRCPFNLDIPPPPKDVRGQLIGYICGKCNFTQISLENLKTHVIVRHNDEQTEVYTINLAVMSNKAMKAMLRRSIAEQPRTLRSSRSNQSTVDASDDRDDQSDVSDSTDRNSECPDADSSSLTAQTEKTEEIIKQIKPDPIQSKLTFENEDQEQSDETSVKMEQDELEADDRDDTSHFDEPYNAEPVDSANVDIEPQKGNSDEVMDYPHFKLSYTVTGSKEYVCCINGNDNHYKTALLISMKKHIQTKHSEKWDGYCSMCKVIVTLQGVQSDFRDCLAHYLDKHADHLPILEREVESSTEVMLALPARIATPPVERSASPQTYIAVRPLAELISKELVKEIEAPVELETSIPFPKIENVVSLGESTDPLPSPVYPDTSVEQTPEPERSFLYEEVQAEVMSKKHRVVLDAMMGKEALVRVFKCAGRFCSFTTDSAEDALLHTAAHQRVGGEGALKCAYCNFDASGNAIDLVMHVFKEHSSCQFSCSACFYRAAASQLVGAHYSRAHGSKSNQIRALKNTTVVAPTNHTSGILPREVAVPYYFCKHEDGKCNFRTYTPGKFCEHLTQKHEAETRHPCHLCSTTAATAPELVQHMKEHGLRLYQCTWCVFGASSEAELLGHAASRHPDKPPQAYLRLITNKDGSSQLRVLPLAYLNKTKVPSEDITPSTTKENPVREAERSIELEKLIGHTMLMIETSTARQSPFPVTDTPNATENVPSEPHASDVPTETMISDDETLQFEPLLMASPEKAAPEDSQRAPVVTALASVINAPIKPEPVDAPNKNLESDIICLDSDDEEPPSTVTKALKRISDVLVENTISEVSNATNSAVTITASNGSKSTSSEVPQRASCEVSVSKESDVPSRITEKAPKDITIEKVPHNTTSAEVPMNIDETSQSSFSNDESSRSGRVSRRISTISSISNISDDDSRHNIIDLSDDDSQRVPSASTGLKVTIQNLFKCPKCFVILKSANGLQSHIKKCCEKLTCLRCPHFPCNEIIPTVSRVLAHYNKMHREGLINYQHFCGICNHSCPTLAGAKMHLRAVHKINHCSVVKKKEKDGSPRYELHEILSGQKSTPTIQRRYGINDVDKLPIFPILDTLVYCELCEFSTKVRINMVRHLQLHTGSQPVPQTEAVNPVPHLETNEMHFDKMVNLASSSVTTKQGKNRYDSTPAPTVIPPESASRYPKYVPERQRHTCGAKGCSYISVDEAMLCYHWETLHNGTTDYHCVHCPPYQHLDKSKPLSAARIIAHLKMHDTTLYACSSCSYYHYKKQVVEKHISSVHKSGNVLVVREEQTLPPAAPATVPGAPTMDLKPWQCGLCKYKNMLRAEVVEHCARVHQSKMQFKCAYCPFRTSTVENITKHQANAHLGKPEEVFFYYYREGSVPDDEDGAPRWQKQRQKLGLEDSEIKTEPEPTEPGPQATMPLNLHAGVDLNIVKKEDEVSPDVELSIDDLCRKFGQFCEPNGIKYRCPLCKVATEHVKDDMQSHLYEELKYRRWGCGFCSYKAFHLAGLNEHMGSEHSRQSCAPTKLPTDVNIEKWVTYLLEFQNKAINRNKANLAVQKINTPGPSTGPFGPRGTPTTSEASKPVESMRKTSANSSASDNELEKAFGSFGESKNQQFSCPKCEYSVRDEAEIRNHLESELTKIRWCCPHCTNKFQTYHEAQFHCKSAHPGLPAGPKEAIRDPSLRSAWVAAVITTQKQAMKVSEPDMKDDDFSDPNENSLLVVRYEEPAQAEGLDPRRQASEQPTRKRPAPSADSDEERLVIDEPEKKKVQEKNCPYCSFNSKYQSCVREHMLRHYNLKPYKCSLCDFNGYRTSVLAHMENVHPESPSMHRLISISVPDTPPTELNLKIMRKKCDDPSSTKKVDDGAPKAKNDDTSRYKKAEDDAARKICLYCEKSVLESEFESHTHDNEKSEFAKRGDVVVKCCECLALRLTLTSLQEHFETFHPDDKLNYAYFKLQFDTREIHCCGHCYRKFKFLRDLKAHHASMHSSLKLAFTSIPFSHNLYTESDQKPTKRKFDDTPLPSAKRVARKSTTKLPNSSVAKKSTTKLPFAVADTETEEFSYYGTKPLPLGHYKDLTFQMPMYNSIVEIDIKKLSGILKVDPRVVLKDCKR